MYIGTHVNKICGLGFTLECTGTKCPHSLMHQSNIYLLTERDPETKEKEKLADIFYSYIPMAYLWMLFPLLEPDE